MDRTANEIPHITSENKLRKIKRQTFLDLSYPQDYDDKTTLRPISHGKRFDSKRSRNPINPDFGHSRQIFTMTAVCS